MLTPYYEEAGVRIYHGDCLEILPSLETVDHVITDPPYSEYVHAMIAQARRPGRGLSKATRPPGALQPMDFAPLSDEVRSDCAVWLNKLVNRWCLIFCDVESSHRWIEELCKGQLEYLRTGAWIKGNCTPQFTGDRPAVGFEALVIAHSRRQKKRWNGGGQPAVWQHRIVNGEPRSHPAEKPLSLMRELVAQFTDPGDLILDPFAGIGTTLRAAKDLGRTAIGIEIEERYCEIAARRMNQGVLPFVKAGAE